MMIGSDSKQSSGLRGREKRQRIRAIKRAGMASPAMMVIGLRARNRRSKTPGSKRRRMRRCLSRRYQESRLVVSEVTSVVGKRSMLFSTLPLALLSCAGRRERARATHSAVVTGPPRSGVTR